jgi:hypothetical protein
MPEDQTYPSGLYPTVQSFILADHVYVDARTGKKVIAGTFNEIRLRPQQETLGREVYAYLAMTNCRAHIEAQLRHVDLSDESVLWTSREIKFEAVDPLQTYEVVIEVARLPFPHPGTYVMEVWCNEQRTGAIRLHAVRKDESPKQEDHQGNSHD